MPHIHKIFYYSCFNIFNFIIFLDAFKSIGTTNYFLFTLISLFSINYILLTWKFYTELFLNIFIYLGFWFKFSITLSKSFFLTVSETNIILSDLAMINKYSAVLNIISLSIILITLTCYLIKKYRFLKIKNEKSLFFCEYILKNHKLKFLFIFITCFLIIILLNLHFQIAVLGIDYKYFFIEKFFKILLFFVLPLTIVLVADIYIKIYNSKTSTIFITILFFFFISISINSRALIINVLPILLIYLNYNKEVKKSLIIIGTIIILFITSITYVSMNRNSNFSINWDHKNFLFNKIIDLSVNRWVGISGMINVEYSKGKNFKRFKESLTEKSKKFNFYERNFYYSQNIEDKNFMNSQTFFGIKGAIIKYNHVYIPGFMAFFYYSGSPILLSVLSILLVIFMIFCEKVCTYYINSKMFVSLFSMILVWRIIHLGLFPINSFIYFLILLFLPIMIYFIDKYLFLYTKK